MSFDINKPLLMRSGRPAGATQGPNGHLYGWYTEYDGRIVCATWHADGRIHADDTCAADLINPPEKRTAKVWMNCYGADSGGDAFAYMTRESADGMASASRIACIEREISYEVGEGL